MSDIFYTRGDTTPIHKTVKLSGVAQNVTGWSFILTVNAVAEPVDTTDQQFQVLAVLTDAPNGEIDFYPTLQDSDRVGTFYFDIQATDAAGKISTLDDGQFIIAQDKTKGNPRWEWLPRGTIGEALPVDGSEELIVASSSEPFTYQDRGGVTVARTHPTTSIYMQPLGLLGISSILGAVDIRGVYQFDWKVYATRTSHYLIFRVSDFDGYRYYDIGWSQNEWYADIYVDGGYLGSNHSEYEDSAHGLLADRYRWMRLLIDYPSATYKLATTQDAGQLVEPTAWNFEWVSPDPINTLPPPHWPVFYIVPSSGSMDVFSFSVERLL